MKNINKFTSLITILSVIVFVYLVYTLLNIFDPRSGVLLKSKDLNSIKYSITSDISYATDNLSLTSVQGNEKFTLLSFKDTRYPGKKNTFYIIYDNANNNIIKNIESDDNFVSLIDASLVQHIKDNLFVVIDANGNIYSIDFSSDNVNVKSIGSSTITRDTIFKSIYSDNILYVITRQYISNYNEMTLNENVVHTIELNKKYSEAIVNTVSYDNSFLYSFVVNNTGNIGIIGSSYITVDGEEVNLYKLSDDEEYLNQSATENNNYKLIDSSTIWVKFFNNSNKIALDNSTLEYIYLPISYVLERKLGVDISVAQNIPLVIGEDYSIYSTYKYNTILYDPAILPSASIFKFDGAETIKSDVSIRSDVFKYNYKNYIAFFNSNEGLIGVNLNGDMELITDSLISYFNENIMLYIKNGNLYFKK